MAISVLDVRDTFAPPRVRVPAAATVAPVETAVRRLPVTVAVAGSLGVLEAIGLMAVALTSLDGLLSSSTRPAGALVAGVLLLLAGWIVLCAGSGAALIDGSGRTLLIGVASAELFLVSMLLVVATVLPIANPTPLPLPVLGLLALAVPVSKLMLVGAPSAQRWVAQGPRARVRRADPVQVHRMLATVTLAAIGLSLLAVTVLSPVQDGAASDPASAVFTQP